MFKFLKEKLKEVVGSFTKKVEEKPAQEETPKTEQSVLEKIQQQFEEQKQEPAEEKKAPERKPSEEKHLPAQPELTKEPEKGFFKKIAEKITTKKISSEEFEELFWDLELALLESSTSVEVIEKIKEDLKQQLANQPLKRSEVEATIVSSLRESIRSLFPAAPFNLIQRARERKPFIICLFGVNGGGKTTTIAKLAHLLKKNRLSVVLAAADTYRAASIEQLKSWAERLNVKLISHEYKSDPAAVAFDAISYAKAHTIDVVLIDTAGRLHSNTDLVREMEKIVRVTKPDLKIFVGESIVGNDVVTQATTFDKSVGIDGIILTKADVDEKGGAIISASYITRKPILYLGTGQELDDLKEFNAEDLMKQLNL